MCADIDWSIDFTIAKSLYIQNGCCDLKKYYDCQLKIITISKRWKELKGIQ